MTATPGQAPEVFARWWHLEQPAMPDEELADMWRVSTPADREFWTEMQTAIAARESHPAPGEVERALASLAAERNQFRIALERIADGSRNRDGMMGCASRALAQHPQPEEPHAAPGLREALGTLVADWREGSEYHLTDTRDEITEGLAVRECAKSLAAILDEHPVPQPAPDFRALIRDNLIPEPALDGPQPAPGLSAALLDAQRECRTAWAADDAGAEQVRLARKDRGGVRRRMLALAAEFGDTAEDDEIEGHTPGSLYMALRAEVLHDAAAKMRKGLDV